MRGISATLLLLLLWTIIGAASCENREVNRTSFHTEEIGIEKEYHFHVLVIDQCHYLMLEVDRNNPHEGFGFFSHRGNCPNPIHCHTKQNVPIDTRSKVKGVPLNHIHVPDSISQ